MIALALALIIAAIEANLIATIITPIAAIVGGYFVFVRDTRKDDLTREFKFFEAGVKSLEAALARADAEIVHLQDSLRAAHKDLGTLRAEMFQLQLKVHAYEIEIAKLRGAHE